jgi:hypothetical protein
MWTVIAEHLMSIIEGAMIFGLLLYVLTTIQGLWRGTQSDE